MKDKKVIIIAMDQPLDSDAFLRGKMSTAEKRATRQSARFSDLNLSSVQKAVHKNILKLPLHLDGRNMGLLDLVNFLKNNRRFPDLTPENASEYYLFANMFTLNGVYLYQYLLNAGYNPEVVQNYSMVRLPDILTDNPLAVCISSTHLYLDDIREIAKEIKEYDSSVPVIVGGILAKKVLDAGQNLAVQTLNWLSSFSGKVDAFVVETHGEETLVQLLAVLKQGGDISRVPNLALFDEKGKMFFTPRQQENIDMDSTAIAWDEIPRQYLRKTISMTTSRGCLYRCRFCTYHKWFPEVHNKSVEVLKDELRRIQSLGFVRHVRFSDDNFTAHHQRLKEVLKMMIQEKFDFTWSAFARASSITSEVAKLMKDSGCDLLNMGIESGNREILKNMDKKLNPDKAIEAIQLLEDYGIDSEGTFVFGYPGETVETFYESIDLINKSGLKYYQPFLFYYSSNMLVHQYRENFGLTGLGYAWRHNTMDSVEASHLISKTIYLLDHAFSDGQQNTWESYKTLRGDDYSSEEIFKLYRLKRDLQLAVEESPTEMEYSPGVEKILREIEVKLK